MKRFTDKVVIITGAASGLGLATAERLAQEDAKLVLVDLQQEALARAAATLGVSIAALARGGVTEALTTEQIEALKQERPEWLEKERATQAEVRKEGARLKNVKREQQDKGA